MGLAATDRKKLVYAREALNESLRAELLPLLAAHWAEVGMYRDIPLDPDWDAYYAVQEMGCLRAFTARDEAGRLRGYAVFVVRVDTHCKGTVKASMDLLYVDPEYRGGTNGKALMESAIDRLRLEGVRVVAAGTKAQKSIGALLERIGFVLGEEVYYRRLDYDG